jgi:hypothetical protein
MTSVWYQYEVQKGISDILQSYIHTNSMGKKLLECPGTVGITSSISFAKKWAVKTLPEVCRKGWTKAGEPVHTKTEAAVAATRGKCSTSGARSKEK